MRRFDLVSQDLTLDEYRELAEFRYQIRCFQSGTEDLARDLGIDFDLYLLLLVIQGLPEGVQPTVSSLSGRMCVPCAEINRLIGVAAAHNLITRASTENGAGDWVKLTRDGREMLRRMASANRGELERAGPELVKALTAVVKQRRRRHSGAAY